MSLIRLQARLYPILENFRRTMRTECPLCGLAASGGDFCSPCASDLVKSLRAYPQCAICADYLGVVSAFVAPSFVVPSLVVPPAQVLPTHAGRLCARCALTRPAFMRTIAAMRYDFPADGLMHAFKEHGQLHLGPCFGRALHASLDSLSIDLDVIVPIPASQASLRRRGFNPAGEIARVLARRAGLPHCWRWLRRSRVATAQKKLSRTNRMVSVQDLYECDRGIPALRIGLVDDVMTTGSTMHAAAQALLDAGARGVVALTVMRRFGGLWHNTPHV